MITYMFSCLVNYGNIYIKIQNFHIHLTLPLTVYTLYIIPDLHF